MKYYVLIFSVLLTQFARAQRDGYGEVLDSFSLDKKFDGVILVGENGKTVYSYANGIADRETGKKITLNNHFKIASLTKTFTATLVMKLVEEGRLELNGVIGKYLKNYQGEAKDKVTIHHLLTYSSGIPDCEGGKGMEVYQKRITPIRFIDLYCSGNLVTEPGTHFNYNNADYIILGKIIEEVTGTGYNEYLNKIILEPLKLRNTGMATSQKKNIVQSYTYNDSLKTMQPDEPYFIENYYAAGAMYSTINDLYVFSNALFGYRLLKKSSVDLMVKPNPDLQNVGYGFWFSNGFGAFGGDFVYRPGGILGATANWIHILDQKKTILILSNTNRANLFEISSLLAAVN